MKRTTYVAVLLMVSSLIGGAVADPAAASTSVAARMTFAEPARPNLRSGDAELNP